MSLIHAHWYSPALQKQVATSIILPDSGRPPFATYYLLHGLSDDHTIWLRRTRIESYIEGLPLMVVMPDGFRGFYTDNENGPPYATYMAEDLVNFVERNFPAKGSRSARCIGGLSMGGYGALRLSFAYPHLYASANSHSGALLHGQYPPRYHTRGVLSPAEARRMFGPRPAGSSHDLLHLACQAKRADKLPRILIDCGTDDHLLEDNRRFHAELEKIGVPHTYREFPGAHTWDYWETHVKDAIDFHAKSLRLKTN